MLKEVPKLAQLGTGRCGRRHREILAYFDVGAFSGSVEPINLASSIPRGIALELRKFKHYILRFLIHPGELQNRINAL